MYDIILVPLDGSKRAETIIKHVNELARKFNSKLILLTAVEPDISHSSEQMASASMGNFTPLEKETNKEKTYLINLQKELIPNDIQVETKVIAGLPAKAIQETAKKENVDLIALASHGHGGLASVIYGSVATDVLNHAEQPLLLIRSRDRKK